MTPVLTSYILAALAVVVVLYYHLITAVFAGLAVFVLTAKLARRLPTRWGTKAHGIALTGIIVIVVLLVLGFCLVLWAFFSGHEGMAALLATLAESLENLKRHLPPDVAMMVPDTVEELRSQLATVLREHGRNITHVGISGAKMVAHLLFGMAIGGITVLHHFQEEENPPPLAAALHLRLHALADAFERVVLAQVKISALNTVLTAIYLGVILPLCGVHLPMVTLLVLVTFVAGLLPVLGNLISNTVIVLISLNHSPGVGAASVGFLVLIHKLEYFTNAKIVGTRVNASSWELLTAMLAMEAVFGVAGIVAAPVVYAWLKYELKARELV